MCVYSMVHDHYTPIIPVIQPVQPGTFQWPPNPEPADAQKVVDAIAGLREALKAAKIVDDLTGQPDCVDPEKAKLMDRIAELEKALASASEFEVVSGTALEPGRYRVVDGKLYRAV